MHWLTVLMPSLATGLSWGYHSMRLGMPHQGGVTSLCGVIAGGVLGLGLTWCIELKMRVHRSAEL